ncbi:hypothetical protein COBT_002720 [Conglomerata obtusa]
MEKENTIKQVINTKNYTDTLNSLQNRIKTKETRLQDHITENHNQIIKRCSSLTNLRCKENLAPITQKLNDFCFSIIINYNELKENEEMLIKLDQINNYAKLLLSILNKLEDKKSNIENYLNYKFLHEKIKLLKKSNFYEMLKIQNNEKRKKLINELKEDCCSWISDILNVCGSLGEKIINGNTIERKELKLTAVLESLYIFNKLENEDEFFSFFNSKRENLGLHLNLYDLIGFLYSQKILCEIDSNFKIGEINTNFEKDELLVLLKFIKEFNMSGKQIEAKLENLAVDYIYKKKEFVNNKEDFEVYFDNVSKYLEGIEQTCVYEIFYKCLDQMLLEYFSPNEIKTKIEIIRNKRNLKYDFKSEKLYLKQKEEIENEINLIFINKEFDNLTKLMLDYELINYIKEKFIKTYKKEQDKIKIEAEIVKFYVHLNEINKEFGDIFYEAVEYCKKQCK